MHEIMTIEEVAAYLRVPEKTVYDWAQKGTIPGGKIGTTWRFKSADIQKWVNEKINKENVKNEDQILYNPLSPEKILIKEIDTKNDALRELITLLSNSSHVLNYQSLEKGIFEREEIMSTGIGLGVAVPHVRSDAVSNLIMAVGIFKNGIMDYKSLDEKPVKIICMIASRTDQHKEYLNMLSAISSKLKQKITREQILNSIDKEFICDLLSTT